MTCSRCEDLEEQVAYWKSEAGAANDADLRAKLRHMFRMANREARLLETLYRHRGRPVNGDRLLELIESESQSLDLTRVIVSRVRAKIGRTAVVTNFGEGYSIGKDGLAAVEAAKRGAFA